MSAPRIQSTGLTDLEARILRALRELDGFHPGEEFTPYTVCRRARLVITQTKRCMWAGLDERGLASMSGEQGFDHVGIRYTDKWRITSTGRAALHDHEAAHRALSTQRYARGSP